MNLAEVSFLLITRQKFCVWVCVGKTAPLLRLVALLSIKVEKMHLVRHEPLY